MAPRHALIVLINGIECCNDFLGASNEAEHVNRKAAILERFPGSRVIEFNAFPGPEVRSNFPMDDWIRQSAMEALQDLEDASQNTLSSQPIVFIANNIGVALAKQMILLTFNGSNTFVSAYRIVAMFFAGYPDVNGTIQHRHYQQLISKLSLDNAHRLYSETLTGMFNILPGVLSTIDSEFATVDVRYCPTYLPCLPLSLEDFFPELEQAFYTIDHIICREHTQLLPTYTLFLQCAKEMASELRRPALPRENIDSAAWVLNHTTFKEWRELGSSPTLFISGPPGFGKRMLSWSLPYLLNAQNQKIGNGQRELYLVFNFGRCNTRLDIEQNLVMSLVYQCLALRPQLFQKAKAMCQLIRNLRPGSVSCSRLWSLLLRLLLFSDDHRIYLILVDIDQIQGGRIGPLDIFNSLHQLTTSLMMPEKLRILVTGRAIVKTESDQPMQIDLADSEESRVAIQRALFQTALKIMSKRPAWRGHFEEITENPCFSDSSYSDTMLRIALLEHATVQSTRTSLTQALKSVESISSTDGLYQLLLDNLDNFSLVREALNWIFHATRPLTIPELSVAITLSSIYESNGNGAIGFSEDENMMRLLEDNVSWDLRRDLEGIFDKVIEVVGSMGNVRIIHNSFRQYFMSRADLIIPDFHSIATENCIAYLSAASKQEGLGDPSRALEFLSYADQNWPEHYKLSEPNQWLDQAVFRFLGYEGQAWVDRFLTNAGDISDAVGGSPLAMMAERELTNIVNSMEPGLHSPVIEAWESEVALKAVIWRNDLGMFGKLLTTVMPFLEPTSLQDCLQVASESGRTEHAIMILSRLDVSDVDTLAKSHESPCLVAARNGHMETVEALLDRLPEEAILQTDSSSRTVFHWAAAWGDVNALRSLSRRKGAGAKILSVGWMTSTPLCLAAAAGSVEAVKFLLGFSKELLPKKYNDILAVIRIAVEEGHEDVVNTLIMARADAWLVDEDSGDANNLLNLAAEAGHLSVFSLLVDEIKTSLGENSGRREGRKRSVNRSDGSLLKSAVLRLVLDSSLNVAARAGHKHIVHYILHEGGKYTPTIRLGFLIRNYFESDCNDTVRIILKEKGDLIKVEGAGLILLGGAIKARRPDLVKYMINTMAGEPLKASNVNFRFGGNLLHYTAWSGHRAVMRELLQHPTASLLLQDSNISGGKPLDVAVLNGQEGVVKEILCISKGRRQFRTIFRAIKTKRVSMVKLLLDNGWEASSRDGHGNTPLHAAIETGQSGTAQLLLQRSDPALLNERNNAGDTPLHIAVSKKDKHIVRWLLDNGADPNVLNSITGLSPLHLLCKLGDEDVEEMIKEFLSTETGIRETGGVLRQVTDFNLPAADGSTPLHYAVGLRNFSFIRALLKHSPNLNAEGTEVRAERLGIEVIKLLLNSQANTDPRKTDRENKPALDIAIDKEEWSIVKELVDAGAEVNPKHNGDNPTPLYAATLKGNLPTVELLLSKGADPHVSGQSSLPAFELALAKGYEDIAKALLKSDNFDVSKDSAPYSFGSHLHAALCTGMWEIFHILVAKRANTEQSAPPYGKPIHAAISIGYDFEDAQSLVENLVEIGSQINDKNISGRTVLSLSATGYPDSDLAYLLNLGANPNIPDQLGSTPLHYAAQAGAKDNLERFIEGGGDVRNKDKCDRSVLYRAAGSGDHDTFMTVMKNLPEDCRKDHLASAIFPAIARRASDIVKTILEETTICVDARDRNGWTILEVAEAYGEKSILRLREKTGDSVEANRAEKVLPSAWSAKDIGPRIRLFENDMGGSIKGAIEPLANIGPTNLRANACMCPDPDTGVFYFEVTIFQANLVCVGFCEEYMMLDETVGLVKGSWGYHSDDGRVYWGSTQKTKNYGSSFSLEDRARGQEAVIGCGVDFRNRVAFFTIDGENQGNVFDNIHGQLYPAVSLVPGTKESRVLVNFGAQPFRYNLKDRKVSSRRLVKPYRRRLNRISQ